MVLLSFRISHTHSNRKLTSHTSITRLVGIRLFIVVCLLRLQFFPRGYVVIILMLGIHRYYYVNLGRSKFCRSFGLPKNCC